MRHCVVSIAGKEGERHTVETDAISLFDAAYKAQQQWALLSWFAPTPVIEVRAGNHRWFVRQERIRKWATGSYRRRRTE
jgi:hypothetical protein